MKKVHYDVTTGKILGWYDTGIHTTIPTPNIEISEADWKIAIDNNANYIDVVNKSLSVKDFRTAGEIGIAEAKEAKRLLKMDGEDYDLNGTIYKVPFTSEDANGLMQVNVAFTMGVPDTNIHFSNGTVMPIVAADFQAFASWFVTKRNSFFL